MPVIRQIKKSKSRKSEPARVHMTDEYEEDEGRAESQYVLKLSKCHFITSAHC